MRLRHPDSVAGGADRSVETVPNSTSPAARSRKSISCTSSYISTPAVSGHMIAHSYKPLPSPTNTARPGAAATFHSAVG